MDGAGRFADLISHDEPDPSALAELKALVGLTLPVAFFGESMMKSFNHRPGRHPLACRSRRARKKPPTT